MAKLVFIQHIQVGALGLAYAAIRPYLGNRLISSNPYSMRINAKLPPHETCGKDLFALFDSIDVIWFGAKVPGSHQFGAFLAGYFGPHELRSAPSSC